MLLTRAKYVTYQELAVNVHRGRLHYINDIVLVESSDA
jgi:hypothetical protein